MSILIKMFIQFLMVDLEVNFMQHGYLERSVKQNKNFFVFIDLSWSDFYPFFCLWHHNLTNITDTEVIFFVRSWFFRVVQKNNCIQSNAQHFVFYLINRKMFSKSLQDVERGCQMRTVCEIEEGLDCSRKGSSASLNNSYTYIFNLKQLLKLKLT